ncbi:MAG: GDP-mannose 4,6-dehydratase [Verrucomicrobia bacterium]|nr:GDP-mannose 4,6-dehydratase [Verrucomicrobiota bacterium]
MSFWKGKRVLITGATGLVGSWLTKALIESQAYVAILLRDHDPQSEFFRSGVSEKTSIVQGVLEDCQTLERAINDHEIDTVFHLGAQTIVGAAFRQPLATFEANIRGTYNLLEACRRQSSLVKRIVIASSDKAYGSSDVLPYTEEMPLNGRHPYDVSKSCGDLIALTYFNTYQLPLVIARCGNIFGGGDLNWSRLIPGTIRSFLNQEAPIIRSDGQFTRDYVYVEDAVHAYMLLGEHLIKSSIQGEVFNFGPNQPYSVLQIVKAIQKCMGLDIDPVIANLAKGEIQHQSLDCSKARHVLNWNPQFSLEEGLVSTIQWYEHYFSKQPILSLS